MEPSLVKAFRERMVSVHGNAEVSGVASAGGGGIGQWPDADQIRL